ncbi:MAG: transcriptional repressor [Acidimicrobiia bacterium]|nr:transcriptional repressor [Acidimicrobiia bacterium]
MRSSDIDVHGTADEQLRRAGQRYTANRRSLVDALVGSSGPVTVIELLESIDGMAQSSAYRNLAVLEEAGVVHRVVTDDDTARYELAEHLTGHHHHLVCARCGAVIDIDVPNVIEDELRSLSAKVARAHGFRIDHHRLDLVGTCGNCTAPTD